MIPSSLEVRPSKIPAAGMGLFAVTEIEANDLVTTYEGRILSTKEALRLENKAYLMRLGPNAYVDATTCSSSSPSTTPGEQKEQSSLEVLSSSYMKNNDKALEEKSLKICSSHEDSSSSTPLKKEVSSSSLRLGGWINDAKPYNAYFVKLPEEGRADVIALRKIRVGEEIYCSYGKWYWAGHAAAGLGNKKSKEKINDV